MKVLKDDTLVLHTGNEFDEVTGAVSVPIYQVSTYQQIAPGEHKGYEYSRTLNPTRKALEDTVAALEGGVHGFAFASGMGALSTLFMHFNAGDNLVVSEDVYGGTYRVLTKVFSRLGITTTFVDMTNPDAVEKAITDKTRAVYIETPTNPLIKVTDIAAIAALTKRHGLLLLVDNTFMSPYWQNPLTLGADVVIHSATKYLGGHSDVIAGLLIVKDEQLAEDLHFLQNAVGAVLPPYDSWLLMRGIKTLGVRMEKHERNAREIAQWLTTLPGIVKVHYPGLTSHPQHAIAKKQASGFGGMVSFDLASPQLANKFLRSVKLITLAESLGGVESLVCLPAVMTHASVPPQKRIELGITDSLVRLSVGIENAEDIKEDILQALK